jgi:hypothetical protein
MVTARDGNDPIPPMSAMTKGRRRPNDAGPTAAVKAETVSDDPAESSMRYWS